MKNKLAILILIIGIIFISGCTQSETPTGEVVADSQKSGVECLSHNDCEDEERCSANKCISAEDYYEELYFENAIDSGKSIRRGDFKVTLLKYGIYKYLEYGDWGDEIITFRADITVENIGSETKSFSHYDAALVQGSKQYDYYYRSEFEGLDTYPGVIREGYILFEDVPEDISGDIKIITGSAYYRPVDYHSWRDYLYSFDVVI